MRWPKCPCWRCREARAEEEDRISPEEAMRRLRAFTESDYYDFSVSPGSAHRWRDAVERRAPEWRDAS